MNTKRLLAFVLACIISMSNPLTVFAENIPVTASGNDMVMTEETEEEEDVFEEDSEEEIFEEEVEEEDSKEKEKDQEEDSEEEEGSEETEEEKSEELETLNPDAGESKEMEPEEDTESVSDNSVSENDIQQLGKEPEIQKAGSMESEYFPSETWSYGVATEFAGGTGSEADPYQIANASQLALFAHNMNADVSGADSRYYQLTASIKLNDSLDNPTNIWPGVWYNLHGGFDGGGYTIENLYIQSENLNRLTFLNSSDEVRSLTVEGIKIRYTGKDMPTVAGIARYIYVMEECHVKGDFIVERTESGAINVAGLAGYSFDEVENCSSSAEFQIINASQIQAGGVIYCHSNNSNATMTNCWFDGSLELDASGEGNSKYYTCGGIVYENAEGGTIKNCYTTETAKISAYRVGGIAGVSRGTIMDCTNNAVLTGNSATAGIVDVVWSGSVTGCVNQGQMNCVYVSGSADASVSGIASKLSTYSSDDEIIISGCTNKTNITGTMGDGKSKIIYVSGIVYMVDQSNGTITVQNCVNEGKLDGKTVAGILCRNKTKSGSCILNGCSNAGELNSTYVVGGIMADAGYSNYKSPIRIIQCSNSGLIQGDGASFVGGIVGKVSLAEIDSCFNVGTIKAKSLGGIVGSTSNYNTGVPETKINKCYNLGPLFGDSIGGIVNNLGTGSVTSCYNMGKLTLNEGSSYSSAVGGIVKQISTYMDNITIQDCFNCGIIEVGNTRADIGGIAASVSAYNSGLNVKVSNCYSIGAITIPEGKEPGYNVADCISSVTKGDGTLTLENIYFLDTEFKNCSYVSEDISVEEMHPCTEDELKKISTYSGFDFTNTWKKGNRKYSFPILRGVGEGYLEYNFAGVGKETVFAQYIIQVIEKTDKETFYSAGIPNATISFRDNVHTTNKDGMICFLAADKELGEVVATHKDFYEETTTITLEPGKVHTIELERKIDIKPPKMNVSASVDLKGGNVESDDTSFSAIDFPFSMELSTSFSRKGEDNVEAIPFQVEVDREKQEIKMSFGMKFKNEDPTYTEECYKVTKETFDKCKRAASSEDVLKVLKESGVKPSKSEWGGSMDFYFMGYMTLYWNGESYAVKESQGLIGLSGSSEFTYRPAATAGVAYGKIELKLSADGTYTVEFDEELQKAAANLGLSLKQALTLAAGVGCELAKIEVGATGEFKETFEFNGIFMAEEDLTIEFNGNPYVEGKLWIFSAKKELKLWNGAQLWPELKLNEPTRTRVATLQEFGDSAEYEMIGREYLNESADPITIFGMTGDSSITPVMNVAAGSNINVLHQDSVYPDARTSLCELADGTKIAAWIADAGNERSDADRTLLCYAVADANGNFGEARAVCDTGRGDYYPVLLAKGNSAYVAWVNADKQYGESAVTVEDLSTNNSIYVSAFDRNTNTFGEAIRITENRGKMPLYLKLASDGKEVTVTWAENSDNSTYMSTGTNTIYSRVLKNGTLADTVTLADGLEYLYDMDTNYVNGKYALVWNQDMDGELSTTEDTEIFCLQNGVKTQLTSNGQMETTLVLTGKDLYFTKEGMICRIPNLDRNLLENTGIVCSSDFKVLEGKAGTALLWFVKDGFVTVPMVSYEKGDAFTDAVVLANMGDISITSCGAIYEDDGSITLFTEQCDVDREWEMDWNRSTSDQSPFGNTNLRYYTHMIPADLAVDDYLYYAQELTAPEEELKFKTEVYNNSDREIHELALSLKKDGNEVAKTNLSVNLSAGASEEIEMPYILPTDFTAGTYTLTVTAKELEENNTGNNSASAEVGYANLVLKDMQVEINENGSAAITGTLKNEGYQAVSNVSLNIQLLNEEGETGEDGLAARTTISEENGIGLGVGETRAIHVTVSEENVVFDSAYDSKVFLVSAKSEGNEILYTDNEETLLLNPVRAESLELGEDINLVVGNTCQLTPVAAPTGAYAECVYTSSDLAVAMVGEDGLVTALGEGTATIMAVTADGMASDALTVTVEAGDNTEEATVEYYLDSESLALELGEEAELSLLWEDITEDGTGVPEQQNIVWTCSDLSGVKLFSAQPSEGEGTEIGETLATATLTGLKAGNAIVTVAVGDSVVLSCVVQVKDNRVKNVSFERSEAEMEKGETLRLVLSTNPAGAEVSDFTFSSSDTTVAVVDGNGIVTALKEGETTIQAVYNKTQEGEEAVKAFCQISVTDITQQKFSLSFDSNGGSTLPEEKASQFVLYGDVFVFPEEVTRPGYYFAGWNTAVDGSGDHYTGTETIAAGSIADGTVLYAQWISQESGMWIADVEDQVYTGSALKPEVAVYDGTKLLRSGVDYTVSYKNNVKPADASAGSNAPSVTIKGRGNYTGSQTVTFTILPVDIGCAEGVGAENITVMANEKVQMPTPVVTLNGKKLKKNKDYTLEYPDISGNPDAYKMPGEYLIRILGTGGYTGAREVTLIITNDPVMSDVKVALNKARISRIPSSVDYTGKPITTDDFAEVPLLQIINGDTTTELVEGTDYTISYAKNTGTGTAIIIFTGINGYTGSIKRRFKITPYDLAADVSGKMEVYVDESVPYSKGGSRPEPVVVFDGKTLNRRTDYSVSYDNISKLHDGTGRNIPTITIRGKGCFTGSIKKTFAIVKQDLSNLTIEAADVMYGKKRNMHKTSVSITDVNGKRLSAGKDYKGVYAYKYAEDTTLENGTVRYANEDVESSDVVPVGTRLYVIVEGKGCYEGDLTAGYRIIQTDISKASITVPTQTYTGKAICPGKDEITVKYDGAVLTADDYDIIGYSNNINKGTAKLTIKGKGNYGGTKTVSFKIKAKSILWWWTDLFHVEDNEEKTINKTMETEQTVAVTQMESNYGRDKSTVNDAGQVSEVERIISINKALRVYATETLNNSNREICYRRAVK